MLLLFFIVFASFFSAQCSLVTQDQDTRSHQLSGECSASDISLTYDAYTRHSFYTPEDHSASLVLDTSFSHCSGVPLSSAFWKQYNETGLIPFVVTNENNTVVLVDWKQIKPNATGVELSFLLADFPPQDGSHRLQVWAVLDDGTTVFQDTTALRVIPDDAGRSLAKFDRLTDKYFCPWHCGGEDGKQQKERISTTVDEANGNEAISREAADTVIRVLHEQFTARQVHDLPHSFKDHVTWNAVDALGEVVDDYRDTSNSTTKTPQFAGNESIPFDVFSTIPGRFDQPELSDVEKWQFLATFHRIIHETLYGSQGPSQHYTRSDKEVGSAGSTTWPDTSGDEGPKFRQHVVVERFYPDILEAFEQKVRTEVHHWFDGLLVDDSWSCTRPKFSEAEEAHEQFQVRTLEDLVILLEDYERTMLGGLDITEYRRRMRESPANPPRKLKHVLRDFATCIHDEDCDIENEDLVKGLQSRDERLKLRESQKVMEELLSNLLKQAS